MNVAMTSLKTYVDIMVPALIPLAHLYVIVHQNGQELDVKQVRMNLVFKRRIENSFKIIKCVKKQVDIEPYDDQNKFPMCMKSLASVLCMVVTSRNILQGYQLNWYVVKTCTSLAILIDLGVNYPRPNE